MPHRYLAPLAAAVLLATLSMSPTSVSARRSEDPRAERERVRSQQAEVASNINVLEADQAEVQAALAKLNKNVVAQEGLLADANSAAKAAEKRLTQAKAEVAETEVELKELRDEVADFAVDAYMMPQGEELDSVLGSSDLNEAAERDALMDHQAGEDADLTDQLRAKKDDLAAKKEEAADADTDAKATKKEAEDRVDKVKAARDQQATFEAQVSKRIDQKIGESISLAEKDKALSLQIALEQAALEARLARERERQRIAAEAQAARDREAARQRNIPRPTSRPGSSAPTGGYQGGVGLTNVDGITVNSQIAGALKSMLDAARADGVSLTGGGYRDPSQQIVLRRAHCGTSDYAIYEMPASQCSPPTAPPGTSMHEVGLAIDFENCSSRSTACFVWLAANAEGFGFYNLPSEPWHWSINGN